MDLDRSRASRGPAYESNCGIQGLRLSSDEDRPHPLIGRSFAKLIWSNNLKGSCRRASESSDGGRPFEIPDLGPGSGPELVGRSEARRVVALDKGMVRRSIRGWRWLLLAGSCRRARASLVEFAARNRGRMASAGRGSIGPTARATRHRAEDPSLEVDVDRHRHRVPASARSRAKGMATASSVMARSRGFVPERPRPCLAEVQARPPKEGTV
jgi:hypothetical protein